MTQTQPYTNETLEICQAINGLNIALTQYAAYVEVIAHTLGQTTLTDEEDRQLLSGLQDLRDNVLPDTQARCHAFLYDEALIAPRSGKNVFYKGETPDLPSGFLEKSANRPPYQPPLTIDEAIARGALPAEDEEIMQGADAHALAFRTLQHLQLAITKPHLGDPAEVIAKGLTCCSFNGQNSLILPDHLRLDGMKAELKLKDLQLPNYQHFSFSEISSGLLGQAAILWEQASQTLRDHAAMMQTNRDLGLHTA